MDRMMGFSCGRLLKALKSIITAAANHKESLLSLKLYSRIEHSTIIKPCKYDNILGDPVEMLLLLLLPQMQLAT